MDADKFGANCYNYSGAVLSIHYLLHQRPYHVMWGGGYVVIDDNLEHYSRPEDLLGISTYTDFDDFERIIDDLPGKSYYEKVKYIGDSNKQWKRISVWDEAIEYFGGNHVHSAKYSGYLINHTQRKAISLIDYVKGSVAIDQTDMMYMIDAVPVLTETGGGTQMVLFDGLSADTTEKMAGTWRGDLLQISDDMPEGYELINCCFADARDRTKFCKQTFGLDKEGYVLSDNNGKLFEAAALSVRGRRGASNNIRVEIDGNTMRFIPVPIEV